MSPHKHLYSIDLIRLLASFSIVIIHTSGNVFSLYPTPSPPAFYLATFLSFFFRWSTPLFVMVSGYLLLNSNKIKNPIEFYKSRLKVLFIPFVFWNIFYFIFSYYLGRTEFTLLKFLQDIWHAGTYYHLYFLFLISGLYVITPLINKFLGRLNLNRLIPLLFGISSIYVANFSWFHLYQLNTMLVYFIPYIGYYLAGYWLSRITINSSKIRSTIIVLLPLIGVYLITLFVPLFGVGDKGTFPGNRLFILVALSGSLIFYKLIHLTNDFFEKHRLTFIKPFSGYTMGIYLIHPFILEFFVITKPFSLLRISSPILWMCQVVPVVFLLSLILVWLIKKVPYLSRIV